MEENEYRIMRASEDAHWWYDGLRKLWKKALTSYFSEIAGLKILDVGCGTGANLALARRLSAQCCGIDKSALAAGLAAERPGTLVIQAEAERLPFQNSWFDAALLMDVLYIRGIDEKAALAEVYRVLKPGAVLLANLPAFEILRGEHDRAVHTRRRYTKSELKEELAAAGFELLKISYWNFFLLPFIFAARQAGKLKPKTTCRSDVGNVLPVLNFSFKMILSLERFFFFKTGLPWGVSVFAAARKPA